LPLILGAEVAGTVERAADGLEEGQRVVAMVPSGGYAEYPAVPLATTFPVPEGVDDGAALALLVQGLTA
jgi:NADPH:quinone reductase